MTARTPPPEKETRESEDVEIQELRRMLAQQQQIIQQMQQPSGSRQQIQQSGTTILTEGALGNYLHFSIRDALEAIPNYDGTNIPFVYFVEGCEEALSMILPFHEVNLVRATRNKLKGDVHRSILGQIFFTMHELVEFLRIKYGPRETVYEAQGRLAYLCQKKDEKVVTYANRVRELGKRILDAQKRETGQVTQEFRNSVEKHLKTSFLRGLNKEIIIVKEGTFEEIEGRAIEAERELETVSMIRRVVLAENVPHERRAAARRIDAEIIICQYCHKKGHTADRCWFINKPQANNRPQNQGRSSSMQNRFNNNNSNNRFGSNNNNNDKNINVDQRQPPFTNVRQNVGNQNFNQSPPVTCGYCKKFGHVFKDCRKRAYDNLRQNTRVQGNEQNPVRTGATTGKVNARPTRVISGEPESETEE